MDKKVIAIIPARGESKRIPHKNKREFNGKPLVIWTIEAALKTKEIDHIIVSSDDQDILNMAFLYPEKRVEVHHRSEEMAKDEVNGWELTLHILEEYKTTLNITDDDIIIYLQPTSPLRSSNDILSALYHYLIYHCDSLISGVRFNRAYLGFKITEDDFIEPLFYKNYVDMNARSQVLPDIFIPNSAIYIISYENLQIYHSFYTPRTRTLIMDKFKSIDLDEPEDWIYGEFVMKMFQKRGEYK